MFGFDDTFNCPVPIARVITIRANKFINREFFVGAMPTNTRILAKISWELIAILYQHVFEEFIHVYHAKKPLPC